MKKKCVWKTEFVCGNCFVSLFILCACSLKRNRKQSKFGAHRQHDLYLWCGEWCCACTEWSKCVLVILVTTNETVSMPIEWKSDTRMVLNQIRYDSFWSNRQTKRSHRIDASFMWRNVGTNSRSRQSLSLPRLHGCEKKTFNVGRSTSNLMYIHDGWVRNKDVKMNIYESVELSAISGYFV